MKYNDRGSLKVLWPSDEQFTLLNILISEVYLIDVKKDSMTQTTSRNSSMTTSSQIENYSYLMRQEDIASFSAGPRTIPPFKKKQKPIPGPLKKRARRHV